MIAKKRIRSVANSCGFLKSELHFVFAIGTNRSSSSFISMDAELGSVVVGNKRSRIDSAILLADSLNCDQRGGI